MSIRQLRFWLRNVWDFLQPNRRRIHQLEDALLIFAWIGRKTSVEMEPDCKPFSMDVAALMNSHFLEAAKALGGEEEYIRVHQRSVRAAKRDMQRRLTQTGDS